MQGKYESIIDFVSDITRSRRKDIKNIAICNTFFTRSGGRSRVIEQQAKDLAREGYNVTVYALFGEILRDTKFKQKIISNPKNIYSKTLYNFLAPFLPISMKLISELKKYDLIIAHDGYPFGFWAYLATRHSKSLYVYWYHLPEKLEECFTGFKKYYIMLLKYFDQRCLFIRKADYIVAVSEAARNDLEKATGLKNIIVIPNKVEYDRFREGVDIAYVEKKFGINRNDPIILFVGRITPQKNVHTLIEVFKIVKQSIPDARLVIVGKPSVKDYFEKIKSIADQNVIFTGYVDDNVLSTLYRIANVYATCSLSESFNLPLKEAQLFGLPVVAFDIPAHREVVHKGILVERGNIEKFAEEICKILMKID